MSMQFFHSRYLNVTLLNHKNSMDEQQFTQQKVSVLGNYFQIYEIIFVSYIWTKRCNLPMLHCNKSNLILNLCTKIFHQDVILTMHLISFRVVSSGVWTYCFSKIFSKVKLIQNWLFIFIPFFMCIIKRN